MPFGLARKQSVKIRGIWHIREIRDKIGIKDHEWHE